MKKPTPFGKYYLLERINVGGMAEVFRAKAFGVEGFERLVAVKRILPNIAEDKEFIRMFIDEAKLAVQLNHANIAQIFDLGVVDSSYYIALEHVHGRDLRAMFDRCRALGEPMPTSQACFVVMKVCEGLDYAHNKRDASGRELHLVHRDVSPQNILVSFEGEVKLIDFGIAKAAGKGSKTQAGILKGKFGYMSPEQVRGIPIDRRSDVFSCGIVLYELLTGERLFVGESDFSTLEKVRNVEILPPSTYNRRIPDELERIVLKALAKDPEDRYQNAIDLHDELQAFVYTAGEFYSRKDLAGWMKKTFGREIEEESAKIESYRQLKPPPELAEQAVGPARAVGTRPPTSTAPIRKSIPGSKPPPPPSVRTSQQMQAVAPPPAAKPKRGDLDLAWDDDELETQIYDNPEDDPRLRKPHRSGQMPLVAPNTPAPGAAHASAEGSPSPASTLPGTGAPDLSSLVSTGRQWGETTKPPTTPPASNGSNGANGAHAVLGTGPSRTVPTPPKGAPEVDPLAHLAMPAPPPMKPPPLLFEPTSSGSFGSGMMSQHRRKSALIVYLSIGGAVLAVAAVVLVIVLTGNKQTPPTEATGSGSGSASGAPVVQPVAADPNTGFDLYVNPPGVLTWRLDNETRKDKLPSRIRGIAPGPHQVAIDAPPGFMSQTQAVAVEAGKAPRVDIVLTPLAITGVFEATPPGAKVTLIVDGEPQELGASPAKAPLDPHKSYKVLFTLQGYVSVNRQIVITGATEEKVAVKLDKAGPDVAVAPPPPPHNDTPPHNNTTQKVGNPGGNTSHGPLSHPDVTHNDTPPPPPPHNDTPPKAAGQGTLLLNSKPVCDIVIDGSPSGLHTPQREIKLDAGKHKITLVNKEFDINESFTVDVKSDEPVKLFKDYSDRLPK